jgi:hypothetical protein
LDLGKKAHFCLFVTEELWRTVALIYVDNGQYYTVSRQTPDKEKGQAPILLGSNQKYLFSFL